jgi:hypothetical protein
MPVSMSKVEEVARGVGNFSCAEDHMIAAWMLKVAAIISLR